MAQESSGPHWGSRRMGRCIALAAFMLLTVSVTSGAASAATDGWSVVPVQNSLARNGQLLSESCPRASDCVAVGSYVTAAGTGATLAERLTATGWRAVPSANHPGATVSELNGVSCSSPRSCVAAGDWFDASGVRRTLVEQLGPHGWTIVPSQGPAGSTSSTLWAVSCTPGGACSAVGDWVTSSGDGRVLAMRLTTDGWRVQHAPSPAGVGFAYLDGIACTASAACTAVGAADSSLLAERLTPAGWKITKLHDPAGAQFSFLNGVACASRSDCTAVGGSSSGPLVDHFANGAWRLQAATAPADAQFSSLFGVSCPGAQRCTAVGGYVDGSGDFVPLALVHDGSGWHPEVPRNPAWAAPGNYLTAVGCESPAHCQAVGVANGGGTPIALAEQLDEGSWRFTRAASPVGAAETQLNAVACHAGLGCIAVGTAGPTRGTTSAVSARLSDRRWHLMPTPTVPGANLSAVSCASATFCVAAGNTDAGTLIELFDGNRWRIQHTPNPPGFADFAGFGGVACTSRDFCMAAGAFGVPSGDVHALTERWNGRRWSVLPTPNPSGAVQTFIGSVSCTSPSACTTVGEQHSADNRVSTVALRWNGSRWHIQRTPNPANFSAASFSGGVSCTSATACIATGSSENGEGVFAERWNGTHWALEQIPQVPGGQLTGLSCFAASACTAIGLTFNQLGGELVAERWNGTSWTLQQTPLLPGAHDIAPPGITCQSRQSCRVVGGYENDGPSSHNLAEQWHIRASAAMSLGVRESNARPPSRCMANGTWGGFSRVCAQCDPAFSRCDVASGSDPGVEGMSDR